jgi:DNA-directed RNA polymerase specialized sigma24 family protein
LQAKYLIIEEIADTDRPDVQAVVRQLPLSKSVPLMMQYYLNATTQEIADYHKITKQAVDRKNKFTLNKIKKMMQK